MVSKPAIHHVFWCTTTVPSKGLIISFTGLIQSLPLKTLVLGVEVQHRFDGSLFLTQSKFIRYLLHNANMTDSKPQPTPMASTSKLIANASSTVPDPTFY
jgi:hypothetical protein